MKIRGFSESPVGVFLGVLAAPVILGLGALLVFAALQGSWIAIAILAVLAVVGFSK